MRALAQTCSEVLFRAEDTFERARRTGGLGAPLAFMMIMGVGFGMISFMMNSALNSFSLPLLEDSWRTLETVYGAELTERVHRFVEEAMNPSVARVFVSIVSWQLLSVFLYTGLAHVCLMMAGAAGGGFEATFRAFAYCLGATAPLAVIPVCGGLVGLLWFTVVIVAALVKIHEATTFRVILGLSLPAVPLGCCGLLVVLWATAALSGTM